MVCCGDAPEDMPEPKEREVLRPEGLCVSSTPVRDGRSKSSRSSGETWADQPVDMKRQRSLVGLLSFTRARRRDHRPLDDLLDFCPSYEDKNAESDERGTGLSDGLTVTELLNVLRAPRGGRPIVHSPVDVCRVSSCDIVVGCRVVSCADRLTHRQTDDQSPDNFQKCQKSDLHFTTIRIVLRSLIFGSV